MAYVERTDEQLIRALEANLSATHDPNDIIVTCADEKCEGKKTRYTCKEVIEALKQKTEFGLKYLESIRNCARKSDRDPLEWLGHYSK